MRLCISLGRLSVSWRAAGVPYLICPHLAQPLSGPAWRKNRGSSLRRRAVLYPLLHVSFAALAPEGGVRTRSGKPLPGRATASCTTRAPPPYASCWSRPSHRWASSRAGADRWTWLPAPTAPVRSPRTLAITQTAQGQGRRAQRTPGSARRDRCRAHHVQGTRRLAPGPTARRDRVSTNVRRLPVASPGMARTDRAAEPHVARPFEYGEGTRRRGLRGSLAVDVSELLPRGHRSGHAAISNLRGLTRK